MLDDSWDSASSPDVKKKSSSNKGQKLSSLGSKYDFPAPASTKRGSLEDSREFDADLLFSPTNSQGSPVGTPVDYKNRSYNFDDSPKKATADYLSNFVLESNELEDSILGGLLGGGAKKPAAVATRPVMPRQRSPQSKLDPIDTSDASSTVRTRQSPRRTSTPPKSFKASNFRNSPADLNTSAGDFDGDDDFPISPAFGVKRHTSNESSDQPTVTFKVPTSSFDSGFLPGHNRGKQRQAMPSFDASHDPGFLEELKKPEESRLAPAPTLKRFTDGLVRPGTSHGVPSEPLPPAPQATPRSAPAASDNEAGEAAQGANADKDDDNAGLAFIPSFMEPGRQNRRRRQLDSSPGKGFGEGDGSGPGSLGAGPASIPKLNDLDIALGLSGATSVPKKAVVDPFSAVDKKVPPQAAAAFQADSDDSSSDDALINRNRYNRKDTFTFNKPAPPGANTAQAPKTVGKEASQSFGATAGATAPSAATAPSRVSTFTPAKPGSFGTTESPAPLLSIPSLGGTDGPAATGPVRMTGQASAPAPGPAYGMKMSDSFEDTTPVKPVSPNGGHNNASLASLPQISPLASYRGASNATLAPAGASKSKAKDDLEDSDVEDLDISGIVRVNIDEDLLLPRSTRTSHKSPSNNSSNTTARPKTASRSPRSSFAADTIASTAPRASGAAASAENVPASVRANSPAGVLTSAVNAYDQDAGTHSRRNSATVFQTSTTSSNPSNPAPLPHTSSFSFQDGQSRDRGSASGTLGSSYSVPLDPPYSSLGNRKGTREDLLSIMEEDDSRATRAVPREDPVRSFTTTDFAPAEPVVPAEKLVQQLHADKAGMEAKLLREIEELKVKLMHPQPASFRHAQLEASSEEREHYRLLQDSNIRYVQEVIDQKRIIAQLESEISRLKDEAIIKARHVQEEMLWTKEKYEGEIKDVKIKNSIEMEALERRQEDAIASLRKLHAHEIESIKERYKSEEKFELIAGQLRSTSGSIQFIEQALQTRQRGVEAMREGQIDARERLLQDMEEKARERAEIAEAEGYRLKGILSHMEHVVSSLREQGSEEKERLRQEHFRLQARQTAFEAERNALQERNLEELAYIKQRSKEVELELARLTQEKQITFEAISAAHQKLDTEKADFAMFVSTNKRAIEAAENRLRDEEQRIARLRNEMLMEKASLDDRRAEAMKDIEGAEELRNILVRAQQENEAEKGELRRISQSYKAASEEVMQQQAELQEQQESLQERELALREGFAQMKLAAGDLSQREAAIRDSVQLLERKRHAIDRADRESMENRLVSAANFREWSARQGSELVVAGPGRPTQRAWSARDVGGGRGDSEPATTAEEIFSKYEYLSGDGHPLRASADDARFTSTRTHEQDRMSRSAQFDSGFGPQVSHFDPMGGTATGRRTTATAEKENMYSQILARQQAEKPWIETFQEKLKDAFHKGGGAGEQRRDGSGASDQRLPAELRTAQMALRQSKEQLSRVATSTQSTQRLLAEESDFLRALQSRKQGMSI